MKPLFLLFSLTASAFATSMGPTDPLYLTLSNAEIVKIQGNSASEMPASNTRESAIAVTDTIRTVTWTSLSCCNGGSQYTLGLTPTGVSYSNPLGDQLIDGTSDGTYNYAVLWYEFSDTATNVDNVYRFNSDWTNPVEIFAVPTEDTIGISHDVANNSLWTESRTGQTISDYSMTGTLLSSFSTAQEDISLAYDPGDGTLWTSGWGDSTLYQYSTSGTLLGSKNYAVLTSNSILGMEFSEGSQTATPEPSTGMLLTAGTALCLVRRPRRYRQ